MTDRIFIHGVELHAFHGLHAEEARLGQRFVIDVDCWLDTANAAAGDDYESTVGYERIFALIHEISANRRFQMLEAFAQAIAGAALERYPRIETVRVTIHKPSAPIPGIFRDAGVEITRHR